MEALCPYYWLKPPSRKAESGSSLTSRMRNATLEAHTISDKLVNAKLVVALADRQLYAACLCRFYIIFKAVQRLIGPHLLHEPLCALVGPFRTLLASRIGAFEQDLTFFCGEDASKHVRSSESIKSVRVYVQHLESLERADPVLLLPYAYHLTLAVLSGGQQIKRLVQRGLGLQNAGVAVLHFDFDQVGSRTELKQSFKSAVDKVGASLTEDTLRRLESESVNVFRLNNAMVSEIGVRSRWWCLLMLLFVAAAALVGSVCELGPSLVGL